MMKIYRDIEQLTPAWFDIKRGKIGATSIKSLLAKGQYKSRTTLLYQKAGEILTGETYQIRQTPEMARGILLEPDARDTFEFITGLSVEQVGWIEHDSGKLGISPDGICSDGDGFECKCPIASTHIKYLIENRPPPEYIGQLQYSLFITGFPHWHFFSYHPSIRPLLLKVYPDPEYIKNLQTELLKFIKELDSLVKKMS